MHHHRTHPHVFAGILLVAVLAVNLAQPVVLQGESLWRKSGAKRGMYADKKAIQTGDIVTIVISESASMANSVSTTTAKSNSNENALTQLIFSDWLKRNGEAPSTSYSSDKSYEGSGEISNRQTVTARISVQVIDTLPNGNLVLEGVRVVSYSGETQYMLLRGIARPTDISSDNTLRSDMVADARIEILSEGSLTDSQKKGLLTRIGDFLTPF